MSERAATPPPICLNLIWHMHQPYYRRAGDDELIMPWVRLHAIKDYYDMAQLIEMYPKAHQTINLVPSLLEQLLGYTDGNYTDRYLRLSRVAPDELGQEDRRFLIERFFDAEVSRMIHPYPRYRELYDLRGGATTTPQAERLFQSHDLRDLQVWFNLTWFDPIWKEQNGDLCHTLIAKGRGFDEEEKHRLLDKQIEVMRKIIPLHKKLQNHGSLEVSTTPFYHPILPLLCDTDEARVALPDIELPRRRFQHPEDAQWHIKRAVEYHQALFGAPPRGMWPSEGSVSPAMLPLVAQAGLQWIATDEDILARTLGKPIRRDQYSHVTNPELLYRPYVAQEGEARLAIYFRDRTLSDNIGFRYQHMDADKAVADFMHRLETIARRCGESTGRPPVVSVILDGENCWEYYARDGRDFLELLYQQLSESAWVTPMTAGEYLDQHPPHQTLPRIFSGSWIMHNYRVWIGHREDNQAWDLLSDLRDAVVKAQDAGQTPPDKLKAAWQQVYVAQGSDWCWWYGDDRSSGQDDLWDQLYRDHVAHGYELLGLPVPAAVREPIAAAGRHRPEDMNSPTRFLEPVLDGRDTHYFEWYGAARYRPSAASGAMQVADSLFDTVMIGFDETTLFVRVDFGKPAREILAEGTELHLVLSEEADERFSVRLAGGKPEVQREGRSGWQPEHEVSCGVEEVVEIGMPFTRLNVKPGGMVGVVLHVYRDQAQVDVCPPGPSLKVQSPDKAYRLRCWSA